MANKFSINIGPGNTIGAVAIGPGAKATGRIGGEIDEPASKVSVSVEIAGATLEQAADWLRTVRQAVNRGEAANVADNTAHNGAKLAYSIKVV